MSLSEITFELNVDTKKVEAMADMLLQKGYTEKQVSDFAKMLMEVPEIADLYVDVKQSE